ncbi:PEP-CTERM sorting domain-containing protein, partial [bacterium]|nr:PEP-CTERM sorting domain-containing protein [bacterium]
SAALVNGVQFDQGLTGSLPANFDYQVSSGGLTNHAGNANHNVTGQVVPLFTDMIYNGGNVANGTATLTFKNLVPGWYYDARVYTRSWGTTAGSRTSNITFDPDGIGPVSNVRTIEEDDAAVAPPALALNQSYAISYRFEAQATEMTIEFDQIAVNASWHLYGVTNEQIHPIVPTVFSTGMDANHDPLAPGAVDPHYTLITSPVGPTAALRIAGHPAWLGAVGEDQNSAWIGLTDPGTTNVPAGNYVYRTTFDLTGFAADWAVLDLRMIVDDSVTDVLLNGASTGISHNTFGSLSPWYTLTSGFTSGMNTLDFLTVNGGVNPHGFRAELFMTALYPEPGTMTLLAFGGMGLLARRRRRRATK